MLVIFSENRLTLRTAILRVGGLSRITHCAPASAGMVLERTWEGCRIVSIDTYARLMDRRMLVVDCGAPLVKFPDVRGPYPWGGAIRKRILGGVWAWDCLGITCRLLVEAGVAVPRSISTPASLLRFLSRDHRVQDLR